MKKNKKKLYLIRYIAMQKIIFTVILSIVLLISACHRKTRSQCGHKQNTVVTTKDVSSDIKNVRVEPNTNMADTGASYVIDSAKVKGDILSLFVNYSGGCKLHTFELLSNGAYAKSLPPQVSVCLKHSSNEDGCRQLITQELKFNISKLKYQGQKTVIINIKNKQRIYYVTE